MLFYFSRVFSALSPDNYTSFSFPWGRDFCLHGLRPGGAKATYSKRAEKEKELVYSGEVNKTYTRSENGEEDENREAVYQRDPAQHAFGGARLSVLSVLFAARGHLQPAVHRHAASGARSRDIAASAARKKGVRDHR